MILNQKFSKSSSFFVRLVAAEPGSSCFISGTCLLDHFRLHVPSSPKIYMCPLRTKIKPKMWKKTMASRAMYWHEGAWDGNISGVKQGCIRLVSIGNHAAATPPPSERNPGTSIPSKRIKYAKISFA